MAANLIGDTSMTLFPHSFGFMENITFTVILNFRDIEVQNYSKSYNFSKQKGSRTKKKYHNDEKKIVPFGFASAL